MNMDALIFEPFVSNRVSFALLIMRMDFTIHFNA